MPRKTASSYVSDIKKRYVEAKQDPTDQKKKNRLRYSVREWAKRSEVEVLAASNEGTGYQRTPEEIGYPVRPMPRYHAKKWPYKQFADYQACISSIGWYGVVIERKTLPDAYGTLIDDPHRENLYEEFDRFKEDPRFCKNGIFRMDFECTEQEFIDYFSPFPKTCKFCAKQKIQLDTGDYWCPEAQFLYSDEFDFRDFHCPAHAYEAVRRTVEEMAAINAKKETVLSRLLGKGIQLCWRGSREKANAAYKKDLQSWMIENYVRLLKLEDPDDVMWLRRKKAYLEAELQAVNASLAQYKIKDSEVVRVASV